MKQLIRKITAFSASAVIAVCSAASGSAIGADTNETPSFSVHFDLSEEGVSIVPDEDGNVPEIKDLVKTMNSTFFIPAAKLKREGYSFTGWTEDDIKGYVGGDVFRVRDHDVTLKPVWSVADDTVFHTVTYRVEWNGEIDKDAEKLVPPAKRQAGKFVSVSAYSFPRDGYKQRGWTDGKNEFAGEEYMIVHDEDVTLYPNLKKLYNLKYSVGDADRINGVTELIFEIAEGEPTNLQNTDRFSRNGFKTIGWHCENDGKDYEAVAPFTMPSEDVLITPIWEPILYTINFKPSNNSGDNIKVRGRTDTAITVPECTYVKEGYTFAGWQYQDTVCQPGEEFIIPGAEPGLGISFKAIWIEGSGEQVTTTATTTTTTTTTTTSSSYTSSTSSATTTTSSATTTVSTTTSTATTTAPVTTSKLDVKPHSFVVYVRDKATNELINDTVLLASWHITYVVEGREVYTGPIEQIDTSVANPAVISFEKYKNAKELSFTFTGTMGGSPYTYNGSDFTAESDAENDITYFNVYLTKSETDIKYGDSNCDGAVDMADAVLIMQALANPNKYGVNGSSPSCMTAEGKLNADVDQNSPGITTGDALIIQKYLLGLVEKLPLL